MPRRYSEAHEAFPNDYLRERGYEQDQPDYDEDAPETEFLARQHAWEGRAGDPAILYVNAYAVGRNYGGPEEGGWWYNSGEPLASVPVRAVWRKNSEGNMAIFPLSWKGLEQEMRRLWRTFADIEEGDIYSARGGTALEIQVETHQAAYWPSRRPHYE